MRSHDRLVLTCVFGGTEGYWQSGTSDSSAITGLSNNTVQLPAIFSIYTLINSTTTVITATNESIPLSANGVTVACIDSTFAVVDQYCY